MWKLIIAYLPDWPVFIQTALVFCIPYLLSRFFNWIRSLEEGSDENEKSQISEQTNAKTN